MGFSAFGLHSDLLRALGGMGIEQPTPIQADAIPVAMTGRDVLATANTGSGKTAAFLLPTLHRLLSENKIGPAAGTRILVLSPTRELAAQIHDNLAKLAGHTRITGASIYGGVAMGPQIRAFRSGANVLVATPGRLLDHLRNPYAKLDKVETVILDEADRMLDMGFLPDIRKILARIPAGRQTLLFSATLPGEIRALSKEFMRDPALVEKAVKAAPAAGITQAVYPVPHHLKTSLLTRLLEGENLQSVICFVRTKARADRLTRNLMNANISCAAIHGDRTQGQRQRALDGFKRGHTRVLVATDVAARGIDVADVSHVINFDVPGAPEDYIHRVGRTGRAAATGDAFTFVSPDEESDLRQIQKVLGKPLPRVTVEGFDYSKQPAPRDPANQGKPQRSGFLGHGRHENAGAPRNSHPAHGGVPAHGGHPAHGHRSGGGKKHWQKPWRGGRPSKAAKPAGH
jgi:ATP-dependent RNA helicase RhlE